MESADTFKKSDVNAFIESLANKGRESNTLKNYRTDLNCFQDFWSKHSPKASPRAMGTTDVVAYGEYLNKRYGADNSRRRRIQTLRLFFDFLVSAGLKDSNPVRTLPPAPKFVDRPRPATLMAVKTVWEYWPTANPGESDLQQLTTCRNQLIFLLIYGCCLKVSDIAKLKRDHLIKGDNGPRVLVVPNKRDPYSIDLPQAASRILPQYFDLLEKEQARAGLSFNELFFNANPYKLLRGGLSPRGIEIIFKEVGKTLMVPFTPKGLRQAGIFLKLHQGLDNSQLKELLGVAPSYDLGPYRKIAHEHVYNDNFLNDTLDLLDTYH